jgi:TolC family type I secretion outer membrane protein
MTMVLPKTLILVFISLWLLIYPADSHALSLENILPKLLEKHERIRAARNDLKAAEEDTRAARGDWMPVVKMTSDAAREFRDSATSHSTSQTQDYGLSVVQPVYKFGRIPLAISRSHLQLQKAVITLKKAEQDVLMEGITAFFDYKRKASQLHYAREAEDNIRKQTGMEESLVINGAGLPTDVLRTKAQLAGVNAARVRAEGDFLNATNRFMAVFYEYPDEPSQYIIPEVDLINLPAGVDQAIDLAMKNNFEIVLANYDLVLAKKDVHAQRHNFFPEINLDSSVKYKRNEGGTPGTKKEAKFILKYSHSLFNGTKDYRGYRASNNRLQSSKRNLLDTCHRIDEQVRKAWLSLKTSRSNAAHLRNQANIAGEFLRYAREERKLGTRSLLQVLDGETNYITSTSAAIAAETDTSLAVYQILAEIGALELKNIFPKTSNKEEGSDNQGNKESELEKESDSSLTDGQ